MPRREAKGRVAGFGYPVRTFQRFCWPEPGSRFECPGDYGLVPEPFETVTCDGMAIRGWVFVPQAPWGGVIVCHARSADKSRTLRLAKLLYDRGLAVACFDFRGCGDSDRPTRRAWNTLWEPLRDLHAVACGIDRRLVPDVLPAHRVALLGCSFGGNMALAYAGATTRVYPAMILDSTPLVRWQTMLGAQLERERQAARFRRSRWVADHLVVRVIVGWTRAGPLYRHAVRSAQRLRGTSVLLIIGEHDSFFDIDEAERFLQTHYAGDKQVWRVPRGRHLTNHLVAPAHYADRVVSLLTAAFDRAGHDGILRHPVA